MKQRILLVMMVLFFSGCIQSAEHLIVKKDGSGTYQSSLKIPTGTMQMVDSMMGGLVKALAPKDAATAQPPSQPQESPIEQMVGNKDQMLSQASKSGAQIEFLNFKKERKEDGLYVDYKIKFDDIKKFLDARIVSTKLSLAKDDNGNWVCELKTDETKAKESKMQVEQFEGFQESDGFKNMDPIKKALITNAMKDFKIEFLLTMPYELKEVTGVFEKKDEHTMRLALSGDILSNPALLDTLYGKTSLPTKAVWNSAIETPLKLAAASSSDVLPAIVIVILKNGNKVEGKRVEQADDHIRVEVDGVTVTYYSDEIEKVE